MQKIETLTNYPLITDDEISCLKDTAVQLIINNLNIFTDFFPESNSTHGFYKTMENVTWTTGFWTGQIWLAYEETKKSCLKEAGEKQVTSFLKRIQNKIDTDHHDMGFLYSPSCVAAYKLTENEDAKVAALLAADNLMARFQEKGQFFQAWGNLGASENYRLIIDCLLNMPLLFWASEVSGNPVYREKAETHIKTAMQYVIRPDHSTYHTYFFEPETGQPLKGVTHQGNRDGSAWERGQAWGMYGAALSYSRLKDKSYLEIFEKLTQFFLMNLPEDLVPYWDFDFSDGSNEPKDSSSSAIAACGMLEMSKYLPEDQAKYYTTMARRLIKALAHHCAVKDHTVSNGLLLHGIYARSTDSNTCPNLGTDECNAWGDYYYMEALTRLSKDWNPYW